MRRLLEVCVEDVHGIAAAVQGGADRIELCAALDVGGLTPSPSLMHAAAAAPIPVHLLVRPRAGDFVYDAGERRLVEEDIRAAADAGLAGVVIGANARDRTLDLDCLARWVEVARERTLSVTLHRAFDLTPDPLAALEQAVSLGFDRILTSGGAPRSADAVEMLTRLVTAASDRITVLVGSGVSPRCTPRAGSHAPAPPTPRCAASASSPRRATRPIRRPSPGSSRCCATRPLEQYQFIT
jgi:copper homeostasis protein CutC